MSVFDAKTFRHRLIAKIEPIGMTLFGERFRIHFKNDEYIDVDAGEELYAYKVNTGQKGSFKAPQLDRGDFVIL